MTHISPRTASVPGLGLLAAVLACAAALHIACATAEATPRQTTPAFDSTATLTISTPTGPPTGPTVKISQLRRDESGPTSMRYYAPREGAPTKTDDWVYRKGADNGGVFAKYYYRDRDLGQTFTTGAAGFRLKAITVRLQPVDVDDADPANARVSVQLMRVTGAPRINDNGTRAYVSEALVGKTSPNGVSVWTGGGDYQGPCTNAQWSTYATDWPHDPNEANAPYRWPIMHYSDDFTEGETYETVALARGGVIPASLRTDDYLRWAIDGGQAWDLAPNTTYAFLFLFDEPAAPGVNRNLPLSNVNVTPGGRLAEPFPGGHMIRRDGASTEREEVFIRDVSDTADVEASARAAAFPIKPNGRSDLMRRLAIPPGTLGYPDVDAYRDMWFVLEGE